MGKLKLLSQHLIESIKRLKLNLAYLTLLSLLSVILIIGAFFGWYSLFQWKLNDLSNVNLPELSAANISNLEPQQLEQTADTMLNSLIFFYTSIIIFIILAILIWSIFEGIMWNLIAKTKTTFRFLSKFFILNLIILIIWIIPASIIFVIFKQNLIPYALAVLLLIMGYFTMISYALFVKNQKILSLLRGFSLGFSKIMLFYAFMIGILIFLIISAAVGLLIFLPIYISTVIYSLFILIFLAILRSFIFEIINDIK